MFVCACGVSVCVCDGEHIAPAEKRLVTSVAKRQSSILKNSCGVFRQAALSALLCTCQSASSQPAQLMWDNKRRRQREHTFIHLSAAPSLVQRAKPVDPVGRLDTGHILAVSSCVLM